MTSELLTLAVLAKKMKEFTNIYKAVFTAHQKLYLVCPILLLLICGRLGVY